MAWLSKAKAFVLIHVFPRSRIINTKVVESNDAFEENNGAYQGIKCGCTASLTLLAVDPGTACSRVVQHSYWQQNFVGPTNVFGCRLSPLLAASPDQNSETMISSNATCYALRSSLWPHAQCAASVRQCSRRSWRSGWRRLCAP